MPPPRRSSATRVQAQPRDNSRGRDLSRGREEESGFKKFIKSKIVIGIAIVIAVLVVWNLFFKNTPTVEEGEEPTAVETTTKAKTINGGTDTSLAQMQDSLIKQNGQPPKGFVWGKDKKLWSLGVADMSEDDAVIGYLRALQLLDINQAQLLSHDSKVLETYRSLVENKSKSADNDYQRASYIAAMQSIEVKQIQSSAGQADNKKTYTIDIEIVDFSDTSFIEAKKHEWFENLYRKEVVEGNSTGADNYIQEELTKYYASPEAKKKSEKISLSVEKLKEINSGWLVRGDGSLNTKLKDSSSKSGYQGTLKHVKDQYVSYRKDRTAKEQQEKRDAEKAAAAEQKKKEEQGKKDGGK